MSKNSFEKRMERRDHLLGLLQSREFWTTRELQEHLQISQRTLFRDLRELERAGYPLESSRGRGGGVRLAGRWGLERLHLKQQEIIEMVLAMAVVERMNSPLFAGKLPAVRQKLAQAFPASQQNKIARIRQRLLIGQPASQDVTTGYEQPQEQLSEKIAEAFFNQYSAEIVYRDEIGRVTQRLIEAHYILINWPAWYVLCWDHLRNDVRLFRLDRIQQCSLTQDEFTLRPSRLFADLYQPWFQSI